MSCYRQRVGRRSARRSPHSRVFHGRTVPCSAKDPSWGEDPWCGNDVENWEPAESGFSLGLGNWNNKTKPCGVRTFGGNSMEFRYEKRHVSFFFQWFRATKVPYMDHREFEIWGLDGCKIMAEVTKVHIWGMVDTKRCGSMMAHGSQKDPLWNCAPDRSLNSWAVLSFSVGCLIARYPCDVLISRTWKKR